MAKKKAKKKAAKKKAAKKKKKAKKKKWFIDDFKASQSHRCSNSDGFIY